MLSINTVLKILHLNIESLTLPFNLTFVITYLYIALITDGLCMYQLIQSTYRYGCEIAAGILWILTALVSS